MAEKVIGVDFGSSGIKLAEVTVNKDKFTVEKQAFLPLEADTVRYGAVESGVLPNVTAELKAFLAEHKFSTKEVVMGINSVDDVFVNRAHTPWHAPKDFHGGVAFDIIADKKLLLGAPDDVFIDAVVFDDFVDETDARKLDVLLCGVTKDIVQRQLTVLQKAGLRVIGSDLNATAALRATRTPVRKEGTLDILVDIGQDVFSVLIHESGKPYSVTLQRGAAGKDADEKISDYILDDSPAKIARTKASPNTSDARVTRALEEYFIKVASFIDGAVASYTANHDTKAGIAGITLIGGGALIDGLKESLSAHFTIPTVHGHFDPEIEGSPNRFHTGEILSSDYMVAVGLAMGETY